MIPKKFLQNITKPFGITEGESEVLSRAIQGESLDDIAQELGISRDALQKRLGEVYKKFKILGFGPGKLAKLQQRLVEEYQKYRQNESQKAEMDISIESEDISLSYLSKQEMQLLYVLLLNKSGIDLTVIQKDIFPSVSLGEILIMVGEMLKQGLLQETKIDGENKFILGDDLKISLAQQLKIQSKLIIESFNFEELTLSDLWQKLGLINDEKTLLNEHILNKYLAIYFNDCGYDAYEIWELNTAQKYLFTALKFADNLDNIYYNLGLVYEKMQDWQSALNYFKEAWERNQDNNTSLKIADMQKKLNSNIINNS
ncbi:MAG: hypothetical protein IGQ45_15205 [Cyanobacterium sp. T60_A2020_053]|nr:hypothetical protein [Cyanobacterium sp. T60_A2020_053]